MTRALAILTLALCGCVPWNEIHGPSVGAGLVYQENRGLSPQVTAGISQERYRAWYGYGGDLQVGYEPWRQRVTATALGRVRFIWFALALGPTMTWSPDGVSFGLAVETGAMVALGAGSTCTNQGPPGCLDETDTVHPTYLPRLHYRGLFLHDADVLMDFGADVLLSSYWLRHGRKQPDEND